MKLILNKNEFTSKLMLGLSAVFCLIMLVKVCGFLAGSIKTGILVKQALAQSCTDPNETEKYFITPGKLAANLKEKNLFVTAKPQVNPIKEVSGILGNEVLINNKWYKVGDKIADARIIAIEPARVKIRWKDTEKYFAPMASADIPSPGKKGPPAVAPNPVINNAAEKPTAAPTPQPVQEDDPLAWMGVTLSEKVRAMFLKQWNTLTDEQKEKHKEEWNKIPDGQKQQIVDSMEQNI